MKVVTLVVLEDHKLGEWWQGIGIRGLIGELENSRSAMNSKRLCFYIRLILRGDGKWEEGSYTFRCDDKMGDSTIKLQAKASGVDYWPPVALIVKEI